MALFWHGAPTQDIIIDTPPPASGTADGTLSVTFADFTLAGTATVTVSASLNATMPAFTLAGTATVPVTASLSATIDPFTLAGTATVTGGSLTASLNATIAPFVLSGTATVVVSASLNVTIAPFVLSGTAFVPKTFPADIDGAVTAMRLQGFISETLVTEMPIKAGSYKVTVGARWNSGSSVTIYSADGSSATWKSSGKRTMSFTFGQVRIVNIGATGVSISIL